MLQGRGALETCTSCQASVTLQHILLAISLLLGHCPLTHVTTVLSFHATNYILTYHINSINFIAMSPSLHVTHHKNITASHPSFLWIFFCTKNNCFYFLNIFLNILIKLMFGIKSYLFPSWWLKILLQVHIFLRIQPTAFHQ
jgi:hypothetical protein